MYRPVSILAAMALLVGCAGVVTAPPAEELETPRAVFVLEHGWHTSLVLSREDGSMLRYVYGDWRWYAERETGLLRAFPTLFMRTQGALGRQALPPPPEAATIRANSRVAIDEIHALAVDAGSVDALIESLEERFDATRETLRYSEAYDLEFVHDAKPYTLGDNSNHVVADWLRNLGVTVRGNPWLGRWRFLPE